MLSLPPSLLDPVFGATGGYVFSNAGTLLSLGPDYTFAEPIPMATRSAGDLLVAIAGTHGDADEPLGVFYEAFPDTNWSTILTSATSTFSGLDVVMEMRARIATGDSSDTTAWLLGTARRRFAQMCCFTGAVPASMTGIITNNSNAETVSTTTLPGSNIVSPGLTHTLAIQASSRSMSQADDGIVVSGAKSGFTIIGQDHADAYDSFSKSVLAVWGYAIRPTSVDLGSGGWTMSGTPGADRAFDMYANLKSTDSA